MNKIKAKAKVGRDRIKLDYEYDGNLFTIETPRTYWNETMQNGEIVLVHLAVLPVEDEKVFEEPKLEEV